MIRKLIQLSPSTSVVSMPAKWLKKQNLKKGDEVTLTQTDNSVIISTTHTKAFSKVTLDLTMLDQKVFLTHVEAAYIAGYDEITLLINSQKESNLLLSVANEVPGMIVSQQSNKKVQFKDITGNAQEDVDVILNRVFNMIIALLVECTEHLKAKDWSALSDVKKKDYAINSYISYCQRQINKFGYHTFAKTGLVTTYLKFLEVVTDSIWDYHIDLAKNKKQSTVQSDLLLDVFRQLQRLHYKYDQKKLNVLYRKLDLKNHIHSLLYDLLEVEIQLQV
ncbi:MAG: phosphate uptake regulator [Candidatus Woesearchaeota archaeon]|jgi:phosphate uptake regulator